MANSFKYNEDTFKVGDTIKLAYRLKEGDKEREQIFTGILLKIKGDTPDNRMITIRKMTKSGIGVERIIPLSSPFISSMKIAKQSSYRKAKLYFIRDLSEQKTKQKIYRGK